MAPGSLVTFIERGLSQGPGYEVICLTQALQ